MRNFFLDLFSVQPYRDIMIFVLGVFCHGFWRDICDYLERKRKE